MRFCAFLIVFLAPVIASAQAMTPYKSLNNFTAYANQSAEELTALFSAIVKYYPEAKSEQTYRVARFKCPVDPETYYLKTAREHQASLGNSKTGVMNAFEALVAAATDLDKKCKALDTYHQLEDYKKDGFAGGRNLVEEMIPLYRKYQEKQDALEAELREARNRLFPSAHSYDAPLQAMITQIHREKKFLDNLSYNIAETIHTGWSAAEFERAILEADAEIKKLEGFKVSFKYPASSQWPAIIEGMKSMLEVKRRAIDTYNHEARQSDRHANGVYLELINYYNGVLVAHYNVLLDYAANDGYHGLKAFRYVPRPDKKETLQREEIKVVPFTDATVALPAIAKKNAPIAPNVYAALENYVEYINESYRQVSRMRNVIRNLSSSASYYAPLTSFTGKGGIHFRHEGFNIPVSFHQKAVADSRALSPEQANVLNKKADVILGILKEIDQINLALEQEIATKSYERDACRQIYARIERLKFLYETWDEKKEQLRDDLQKIFDSYASPPDRQSWVKSGQALRTLADEDKSALFDAKRYYRGEASKRPVTANIDRLVREVLTDEFENMKGIEKYGRSNGRCPYTPYEDLPKSSRSLSEALNELKPPSAGSSNHPYHGMVYHYNDVVRYFNKFSELSPAPLLKAVYQPELFEIKYPKSETPVTDPQPTVSTTESPRGQQHTTQSVPDGKISKPEQASATKDVRVVRDTVYIERRDTVYVHESGEDLRSMEGYATNNLVLLLDVSGSMNAPEKLPLLKKSVLDLLSMMREEDEISIVVFSGKPNILLKPSSFKQDDKIRKAIASLKPSGKTDANAGLKLAYKVANDNYKRGGNNRIILATDGQFNLADESKKLIADFSREDIYLSVFNFGKAASAAASLRQLAGAGHGTYQYISSDNVELQLIREVKAKRKN